MFLSTLQVRNVDLTDQDAWRLLHLTTDELGRYRRIVFDWSVDYREYVDEDYLQNFLTSFLNSLQPFLSRFGQVIFCQTTFHDSDFFDADKKMALQRVWGKALRGVHLNRLDAHSLSPAQWDRYVYNNYIYPAEMYEQ